MLVIYLVGLRVRGAFEPNRDFEGESLEVDEVAARQRSAEKRAAKSAAKGAPAGDSASSSGSDGTGSTAPDGATEAGPTEAGTNTDANSAVGDGTSPAEPAEPENPPAAPGAPAVWPLLGSRGFWRRARVAQTSERAHFAGVLSFVLLLLTIDALFELPDLAGTDPNTWASVAADKAPVALMGFIVSLGLMVLTIIVVSLSVNDTGGLSVRATRRLATTVLVSSAICYVAWTLWSIFGIARGSDGSGDERFEGLSVAPVAISTHLRPDRAVEPDLALPRAPGAECRRTGGGLRLRVVDVPRDSRCDALGALARRARARTVRAGARVPVAFAR